MGNGSAFLQGMLGGLGGGFSEGIGRWTTARDKAAEMAAMAEERKWQREQAAKTFGLHEKQAKTAALDSIRKAIKDNTITPYHEQLIKDYGFTSNDVAPVVNAGLDAEMGWGQQPEAAPAPQEPKVAMTNYTQDNVAGKTIDGEKTAKTTYGTFNPPINSGELGTAKDAIVTGIDNARYYAGQTEGAPGAKYTPEERSLINEGKAAAFYQGAAQSGRFEDVPKFEAAAKQPWDTYNRETLVAEAPSQNVQMDNYVTDENTGMVRPASITAPISKPTPSVSMPSPLSLAAQNYASDVAAQKAAQRAHDMAKEQKRYEGKKYQADRGYEGRVEGARIGAGPRWGEVAVKKQKIKITEDDITSRIQQNPERYAIVKDGKVVGYNRSLAKSDAVKDTKLEPGVPSPEAMDFKEAMKEVDAANAELKAAQDAAKGYSPKIGGKLGVADPSIRVNAAKDRLAAAQARAQSLSGGAGNTVTLSDDERAKRTMTPEGYAAWKAANDNQP